MISIVLVQLPNFKHLVSKKDGEMMYRLSGTETNERAGTHILPA